MAERSITAFGYFKEAEQKFDYFVCGVSGTLCAFLAERYTPARIGPNAATAELIAILLLVLSFYYGFRRIQMSVVCRRLNAVWLDVSEKRGGLISAFEGGPVINRETGDVFSPEITMAKIQQYERQAELLDRDMATAGAKALTFYKRRNLYLFLGFGGLLAARLLKAYL